MIAESPTSARAVGSDLATELGFDLANGVFLRRLPAYMKAARTARRPGAWWCVVAGSASCLANILALLGVACLLYLAAYQAVPWLGEPGWVAAYGLVLFVAAGMAFKTNPSWLWAAVLGSAAGSLALLGSVVFLWSRASLDAMVPLFVVVPMLFWFVIAIGTAIAAGAHLGTLATYLLATAPLRSPGRKVSSFFAAVGAESPEDALALLLFEVRQGVSVALDVVDRVVRGTERLEGGIEVRVADTEAVAQCPKIRRLATLA
jgi:hypothetical protein